MSQCPSIEDALANATHSPDTYRGTDVVPVFILTTGSNTPLKHEIAQDFLPYFSHIFGVGTNTNCALEAFGSRSNEIITFEKSHGHPAPGKDPVAFALMDITVPEGSPTDSMWMDFVTCASGGGHWPLFVYTPVIESLQSSLNAAVERFDSLAAAHGQKFKISFVLHHDSYEGGDKNLLGDNFRSWKEVRYLQPYRNDDLTLDAYIYMVHVSQRRRRWRQPWRWRW